MDVSGNFGSLQVLWKLVGRELMDLWVSLYLSEGVWALCCVVFYSVLSTSTPP